MQRAEKSTRMQLVSERGMAWLNAPSSGRIIPYLVAMMLAIMLGAALIVHFQPEGVRNVRRRGVVGGADRDDRRLRRRRAGDRWRTFIGGIVMFVSVATVSLVTAVVTAGFVAYQQRRLSGDAERQQELVRSLGIEARLERASSASGRRRSARRPRPRGSRRGRAAVQRARTCARRATTASRPTATRSRRSATRRTPVPGRTPRRAARTTAP